MIFNLTELNESVPKDNHLADAEFDFHFRPPLCHLLALPSAETNCHF